MRPFNGGGMPRSPKTATHEFRSIIEPRTSGNNATSCMPTAYPAVIEDESMGILYPPNDRPGEYETLHVQPRFTRSQNCSLGRIKYCQSSFRNIRRRPYATSAGRPAAVALRRRRRSSPYLGRRRLHARTHARHRRRRDHAIENRDGGFCTGFWDTVALTEWGDFFAR